MARLCAANQTGLYPPISALVGTRGASRPLTKNQKKKEAAKGKERVGAKSYRIHPALGRKPFNPLKALRKICYEVKWCVGCVLMHMRGDLQLVR